MTGRPVEDFPSLDAVTPEMVDLFLSGLYSGIVTGLTSATPPVSERLAVQRAQCTVAGICSDSLVLMSIREKIAHLLAGDDAEASRPSRFRL